jgi:hypothetical protein
MGKGGGLHLNDESELVSMSYQDFLELYDPESELPKIKGNWERTSNPTIDYNCLAHAVGISDKWFHPQKDALGYWWPEGIDRKWDLRTIRTLLASYGYSLKCRNREYEKGFSKIAIYTDRRGLPLHFARQLESGKWTSKLGEKLDLCHNTLECLEDGPYGRVREIVKKKLF